MKILITRTDRIGDVVLSTPAIKAVRDKYPEAYIAFMVRPESKEIVYGNPYLNEVIIYDKYGKHRNFLSTFIFAIALRKKRFDLAIMLHPTNRVHLVAYLAGIQERIGYDRKWPFLLTKRMPHKKQEGKKHEFEYTLDILKFARIDAKDAKLFVPLAEKSIKRAEELLAEYHVGSGAPLVAVNPDASCPSKRWPARNFAVCCDRLAGKFKARIIILSGREGMKYANEVADKMTYEPVNLAGKTSIGEVAALLSKCALFISNDSGPVHIACAVGTPVIAIFGRKDPGLSPARWRPLGYKDTVFHKDAGCSFCFAHKCDAGFKCLEAITPEEVFKAADKLLAANP
ncbi:MAG: lipopolysaccharide heptosyltransferase II [Candidatus Omnitrophica bacterium]|nr:lipopolysaccharide heptosyltransferase II [Candidatus Omnitrophota bacterium]